MPRETYAKATDLVLGSIPLPADAEKYVEQAADEIDSLIGLRYATPVVVDSSPVQRPVGLLLKKINIWLASGRLIMAADSAGADDQVQQYGKYLVDQAITALQSIVDGGIILPGIESADGSAAKVTGPVAAFADESSLVEGFADNFGNPAVSVLNRPKYMYGPFPYTY